MIGGHSAQNRYLPLSNLRGTSDMLLSPAEPTSMQAATSLETSLDATKETGRKESQKERKAGKATGRGRGWEWGKGKGRVIPEEPSRSVASPSTPRGSRNRGHAHDQSDANAPDSEGSTSEPRGRSIRRTTGTVLASSGNYIQHSSPSRRSASTSLAIRRSSRIAGGPPYVQDQAQLTERSTPGLFESENSAEHVRPRSQAGNANEDMLTFFLAGESNFASSVVRLA